jgi:hypothetical protein
MRQFRKQFLRFGATALTLALFLGMLSAPKASAYSQQILDAQRIINSLAIPVGPLDGLNGPNTAQGYCGFRMLAGLPVSRANLDTATWQKLQEYKAAYGGSSDAYANLHATPKKSLNGKSTYLLVDQTCQLMQYVYQGTVWAVIPVSTGRPGLDTPNGSYTLGPTVRGWSCSTIYPETCYLQKNGEFVNFKGADGIVRNKGNMYNKRGFLAGGFYVHGSNTVPTSPQSGGCIRVSVPMADWLYHSVPSGVPLYVTGKY